HAPYGLAAKQALTKAGVWNKIKDKLVYGKNIQDTLTIVQTGNAEAGIIALSIVKTDEVNFSLIDDSLHAPLDQAMAVVKGTPNEALAREFVRYVNGPQGRAIMKKYEFILPGEM
ncbi:MAG: molybdate ABC transporter substrate-binding protein, partial [Negativicutes bacterium]|nr:molybdate ABC transporter substrate-binding protein [Negativicutes bacterium]